MASIYNMNSKDYLMNRNEIFSTNHRNRKLLLEMKSDQKDNMKIVSDASDDCSSNELNDRNETAKFDPIVEKQYLKQKMIVSNKYNSKNLTSTNNDNDNNNDITTSFIYFIDFIVFSFILFVIYIFQLIQK